MFVWLWLKQYSVEPHPCIGLNCELDTICVDGECQRDCSVLNIDEFLTDCSTEYDTTVTRLDAVEALTEQITEINVILDKLSAYSPGISNVINDNDQSVISTKNKDNLIVFLLVLNILMIIGGCIACLFCVKSQFKYSKYQNVIVYESKEEEQKLQE